MHAVPQDNKKLSTTVLKNQPHVHSDKCNSIVPTYMI